MQGNPARRTPQVHPTHRVPSAVPRRSTRSIPRTPIGDPRARIHVAPVGFEVERITEPILSDRADRVYLLTRSERDAAQPFVDAVVRRLRAAPWPVDVQVTPTEIWDVFGALGAFRQIFESERRLDRHDASVVPIRVNVSTGTKITSIAGTLSCMLWKGEPYYVRVSRSWYSNRTPRVRPVNDVVSGIDPVGVYELRAPGSELVEVLDALDRRGGALRKRELLRELGLDATGLEGGGLTPQAQHGRLRRRLEPLEQRWGFVRIEGTGPRGRVRLTEQGKVALVLFGSRGTGADLTH